eukprot:10967085-Lingulodinium_polyedra.AAC.1
MIIRTFFSPWPAVARSGPRFEAWLSCGGALRPGAQRSSAPRSARPRERCDAERARACCCAEP